MLRLQKGDDPDFDKDEDKQIDGDGTLDVIKPSVSLC